MAKAKPITISPSRFVQISFTLFILFQTPCMVMETKPDYTLSPLAIAVAHTAEKLPDQSMLLKAILFPGNWIREAFVPYLVCMIATPTLEECQPFMAQLWDAPAIMSTVDLEGPRAWVKANVHKERELFIAACAFISLLGICSYLIPLRISIFGFIFMTFAMLKAEIVPMPPFLGMSLTVGIVAFYFSSKPAPASPPALKNAVPEVDAADTAAAKPVKTK